MSETSGMAGGRIKSPQDFVGALILLAFAAFCFWIGKDLSSGTLRQMGPGMLPKSLAVILGVLAIFLLISSLKDAGAELEAWSFRGMIFILGAFVAFGLAVRPLGLAVAGPLAVIISGFASDETRLGETIIFGLVMTAFCICLFKLALGLPIPLAPWLLGY